MVEGARLESVCRGNSTVGSNPTLSAIISLLVLTVLDGEVAVPCNLQAAIAGWKSCSED